MDDWPKSTLHDHLDVAAKVGLVVADYALLETLTFVIYALVAKTDPDRSFRDFYALRSIRKRETLISDAMGELDPDLRAAFKRAWKRFRAAANRRTEIAHCSFLSDGKTVTRLRLFGTEPRFEPMSADLFERTFKQYQTLGKDLGMLASEIAPYPGAIPELVEQLPLGRFRQKQTAMLGSPHPPHDYGATGTIASLDRLKLLDWVEAKWRREGTVPPDYEPPWRVAGLSASKWLEITAK